MRPVWLLLACLAVSGLAGCLGGVDDSADGVPFNDADSEPAPAKPQFPAQAGVDVTASEIDDAVRITSFDGTELSATLFKPPNAGIGTPVPMIFHSNYYSGFRWHDLENGDWVDPAFENTGPGQFLQYGFGVVSLSQRGNGESDGIDSHWHAETVARDHEAVFGYLATLDWVAKDNAGDPVVGGIGFSYGAVDQILTALWQTQAHGKTSYDAIAPFSFPFDTMDAWFPSGIPNAYWWEVLFAGAIARDMNRNPTMDAIHHHQTATGNAPDGSGGTPDAAAFFAERSPASFVAEGILLDIPVLTMTGMQDTWFHPNHAFEFHAKGLTAEAANESRIFMQRFGHTLPIYQESPFAPCGTLCPSEPCGSAWEFMANWYRELWYGIDLGLGATIQLAAEDECIQLDALPGTTPFKLTATVTTSGPAFTRMGSTLTSQAFIADGPMLVAGIPTLNATLNAPAGSRLFVGLAVDGPEGSRIIGDQWTPYQVSGESKLKIDLHGVATRVAQGESLYLVATQHVDWFGRATVRPSGPVTLSEIQVGIPIIA